MVALNVPAGAYSITSIGKAKQDDVDRWWWLACRLWGGSTVLAEHFAGPVDEYPQEDSIAMMGLRSFSGPATIKVTCQTHRDGVSAHYFGIQAIKLD